MGRVRVRAENKETERELKKRERETGFLEAMFSEERDEKIPFFNLGFQNQWKKNLTDDVIKKIENKFQKEMRDLDYL